MKALDFNIGDKVVYPSHGVGEIINIETQKILRSEIQVYVVSFSRDSMKISIPTKKAVSLGLREVIDRATVTKIYETLQGRAKQLNKMWTRRAQDYENKIKSGDVIAIAEVLRDLYRNINQDRSYSERTLYEAALNRLSGELAVLENIPQEKIALRLITILKEKTEYHEVSPH